MGTVAPNKDEAEGREPSESSGLADIMEIAASLGIDENESEGARAEDDEVDDDLHNLSAGYGGTAAAALVADATVEPPKPVKAANAPKSDTKIPVAAPEPAKPPPPPPAKASASSTAIPKAPLVVASPPPARKKASGSSTAIPAASASTSVAARIPVPMPLMPVAAPAKSKGGSGGAWVWATVAIIVLGAGAFWVMNRDAGPSADTQVVAAELVAPEPEPEPLPEPPKPAPVVVAPPVPEPIVEPVVEEPPPPAPVEVAATVTKRKGKKGGAGAAGDPAEEEKDSPFEDKTEEGKFSAECLLDPSKPGCEELLRRRRGKGTNLDATLSDKLTQTQIREGFSKVKGKAKACGAEPGTTVRVKVSISGDGDVISAEALPPHDSESVGKCVADALKDAKFDRFTSPQLGTVYPVLF